MELIVLARDAAKAYGGLSTLKGRNLRVTSHMSGSASAPPPHRLSLLHAHHPRTGVYEWYRRRSLGTEYAVGKMACREGGNATLGTGSKNVG